MHEQPTDDTWKDISVIDSIQLDKLLAQCDSTANENYAGQEISSPFGVFPIAVDNFELGIEDDVTSKPFSPRSIDDASGYPEYDQAPVLIGNEAYGESDSAGEELGVASVNDAQSMEQVDAAPAFTLPLERPIECTGHGLPYRYASLLDAYISLVVPTLVPMHDDRNPWLQYPAIALFLNRQDGKQTLLHSLLAHAAFSLSHRASKRQTKFRGPYNTHEIEDEIAEEDNDNVHKNTMVKLGCKFYSLAATELRACIQDGSIGCLDLLTTSLSLLLVEVRHATPTSLNSLHTQ